MHRFVFFLSLSSHTITLVNRAGQVSENVNFCDCVPKTITVKRTRFVLRSSRNNYINDNILYYYKYSHRNKRTADAAHMQQRNI